MEVRKFSNVFQARAEADSELQPKFTIPIKIGTGSPAMLAQNHVEPTKNTNEQSHNTTYVMVRVRYALQ